MAILIVVYFSEATIDIYRHESHAYMEAREGQYIKPNYCNRGNDIKLLTGLNEINGANVSIGF